MTAHARQVEDESIKRVMALGERQHGEPAPHFDPPDPRGRN